MKHTTTILLFIFIICYGQIARAQFIRDSIYSNETTTKNNILKTNPLAIIQGPIMYTAEYKLGLEHRLNNKSSFQIAGSYLGKSFYVNLVEAGITDPVHYIVKGYRFQAEYRYFISTFLQHKKAPEGLYLAPTYSYSSAKLTDRYYNSLKKNISFTFSYYCLKLGYQIVNNTLVFDFFIGAGYKNNLVSDNINTQQGKLVTEKDCTAFPGHFKILFGFNMGWAF